MKEINLIVAVDVDSDYSGEFDIDVELEDEMYDALSSLVAEYRDKGEELTEEDFEQKLPEVYDDIKLSVDCIMPNMIDLDEDQDIIDFMWYIRYPNDICELFDE